MFGITASPFHVAGLLLHVLNALLVYRLCLELLGRYSPSPSDAFAEPSGGNALAAFLAAGLWAVHPLRVEVAAWTSAQPYAFATATGLLALLAFLRVLSATGPAWRLAYLASVLLFSAAVLSHPHVAALCVVFPAVHYMQARSASTASGAIVLPHRHPLIHLPFFIVAVWSVSKAMSARAVNSGAQLVVDSQSFEPLQLLLEATKVAGFVGDFSLFHAWLPLHGTLVYERYTLASWSSPFYLASMAGLLAIAAAALIRWRRGLPGLALLVLCHLSFSIPAAGPFVENFRAADRYVYMTAIVAAVALAFGFRAAMRFEFGLSGLKHVFPYKTLSLALVVLGFAMSSAAGAMGNWRDTSTLMRHLAMTGQDAEFRVYARVLESAYWVNRGEIVQARRALMALVEPTRPTDANGERMELMMLAFRFLARTGNCDQMRFVSNQVLHELRAEQKRAVAALAASCG